MSQSHVTDELPNKEQIQSQSKKIQDSLSWRARTLNNNSSFYTMKRWSIYLFIYLDDKTSVVELLFDLTIVLFFYFE